MERDAADDEAGGLPQAMQVVPNAATILPINGAHAW